MNTGVSLSELHRRTDRQLVFLVRREIEQSLRIARRNAGPEAEAAYRRARNLFTIARPSDDERAELESRLNEVRETLDRTRPSRLACAQSACC